MTISFFLTLVGLMFSLAATAFLWMSFKFLMLSERV